MRAGTAAEEQAAVTIAHLHLLLAAAAGMRPRAVDTATMAVGPSIPAAFIRI